MRSIEMEGKSVEEAIEKAIKQLNVNRDNVKYEIIENGSKGLFNVIGVKPAKVKVWEVINCSTIAKDFLNNLLKNMQIEAEIKIEENDNVLNISLLGEKMGLIIGYRGETLDAIQYLTSLAVNKNHELPHKKIILDTENYRSKREETLKGLAIKSANRVKKTNKALKLEPMNPYERRIIHSALQNDKFVITHSEGEEPFRRIVIDLK